MEGLINLEYMLLYFLFGIAIALLEMTFQHYQTDGMIFDWYRKYFIKVRRYHMLTLTYTKYYSKWRAFFVYIMKPLGLCPYCNGTWLAIIAFYIAFGLNLGVFLVIGISWSVIRMIDKYNML